MSEHFIIYTDGGARGNPGPAATGVVIYDNQGTIIDSFGHYLGEQTNNVAEYTAIIEALERAKELGAKKIECRLDSKLVVEQLNRNWKVKEPTLQTLFVKAYNLMEQLDDVTLIHIPREENKAADAKVNEILDSRA